ncbi:MAG TPA: type II/IV secretion system ATPase subunit [Methanocorpusculum sp.]|nr:type II/IV secretion system ATPase subunit [Methanocorpusculum sp.]
MKKKKHRGSIPEYSYERDGPLLKTSPPADSKETRWLVPGTVRISITETSAGLQYQVSEPELSGFEQELLPRIKEEVRGRLVSGACSEIFEALTDYLSESRIIISPLTIHKYRYYLERDFLNWGKIDALRLDDEIEDISCGGYGHPVFIYHRRYKSMQTNIIYTAEELDSAVVRFAERGGKQISLADCMADTSLPDGSRLQLTYGTAVSANGSTFSLRRFRKKPLTPVNLILNGTFTLEEAAYLWYAVETGHSILIIGETASGKTTTLNALAQFIPPSAKIVSIEDTREIMLYHENWIPNQVPSLSKGEITMFDLLRAALRQRPEYLLVGEVRGIETLTMFQAMNTGHITFSTFHAGDISSAICRLLNEPLNVPLPLLESLDIVIAQKIEPDKSGYPYRRCSEISEIVGMSEMGSPHINMVYSDGKQQNTSAVFTSVPQRELRRREDALKEMTLHPDYQSFNAALKEFYG